MKGFMAICDHCKEYRECLRFPPLSKPYLEPPPARPLILPNSNSTLCCPCRVEQLKENARHEHEYRMGL